MGCQPLQEKRPLGTGEARHQGHHPFARKAVHRPELIHHPALSLGHLLGVQLHQGARPIHDQVPGSPETRVAPPDRLPGLHGFPQHAAGFEAIDNPVDALGREDHPLPFQEHPQFFSPPARVLLP